MATTITVAIPTHNRADTLSATLDSITRIETPPASTIDCLVVDNSSTDTTAAVIAAAVQRAPFPLRGVFEERVGSSFARNRAIAESRAEYIFYIDDDALAEPSWAVEMLAALTARRLDAACGMVLPRWNAPPPAWLGPSLWVKLAVHDGEKLRAEPADRTDTLSNYFSANVGLRRDALVRFGGFREDLGNVGGNPMSGEDTELFQRIIARGGRMGFAPRAIVHHLIGPERMTRRYLVRKSFAYGVGSAIAGGRHHNYPGKLIRNAVRMASAAIRGDLEHAIYHELECANFFGYWRGRMHLRGR